MPRNTLPLGSDRVQALRFMFHTHCQNVNLFYKHATHIDTIQSVIASHIQWSEKNVNIRRFHYKAYSSSHVIISRTSPPSLLALSIRTRSVAIDAAEDISSRLSDAPGGVAQAFSSTADSLA